MKNKNSIMTGITKGLGTILIMVLGLATLPASAGFIGGEITMSGDFLPTGGNSLNDNDLATATGIDFLGNDFGVDGVSGDFALANIRVADAGILNDFSFANFGPAPMTLWSIGGFEFILEQISVEFQNSRFLILTGRGTVTGNGFDPTNGSFSLSGNRNGSLFSFSSGSTVPEPGSLLLIGLGLAGMAATRRRRANG